MRAFLISERKPPPKGGGSFFRVTSFKKPHTLVWGPYRKDVTVLMLAALVIAAGCVSQRGGDSGIDQVAGIYGTTPPQDAGGTGTEGTQKQVAGIRGEIDTGDEGGEENAGEMINTTP